MSFNEQEMDEVLRAGILTDVSDEALTEYTDEQLKWHLVCSLVDVMNDDLHERLEGYHNTLTELSAPTPELMISFLQDHLSPTDNLRMFETYRFAEVSAEVRRRADNDNL